MWYQVSGKGAFIDPEDDIEPPVTHLTVTVEAKTEDYIIGEYALFEGLWVGDKFAYFQEEPTIEPTIEPLPADQLNLLIGAPTLFELA